jgi:hypothetical protein
MVPTPGAPFNPVVYSQAGSPGPTRCFAFVIPPGSTLFEIFINNRPTGNIVVSKLSRGRAGAFTFAGAGSPGDENLLTRAGDCAEKVNGTDLCNGLENAFQINTSAITHTGSYGPRSVDSRTIFDLINNLTPYGVTETGAPLPADLANWVQGALSCTGDNGTPNNLADDHPASPNTAFGVAPNEIVSCKITNSLKACSYTQGAWFAPPKDNNPASLLVTAPIFPLTTGVTRNVQFTAASNVAVASPGGTPGVLGLLSPYVNPLCFAAKTVNKVKCPGTGSGNLGSQTVALKINILMGDNNLLPLAGIGDFILGGLTDADACFNTMTVRNLLTTVLEPVLGGSLAIPSIPCVGGGFYTGNIGTLTVLLGGSLTDTGITGLNPSYDPRNSTTGTVCAPSQWAQDHLF